MIYIMKAKLLQGFRLDLPDNAFIEVHIWRVPFPVPGCSHRFKYRLAYVADGVCVLRYDNERGKGDHRHWGGAQSAYAFSTRKRLLADFYSDIERWKHEHRQ